MSDRANLLLGGAASSPTTRAEALLTSGAMPAPDSGGGTGMWGWLGNLGGDVKDLGSGLASLVSSGAHDIGRMFAQGIPGRQDWGVFADNPSDQYRLDDIAKALPGAIAGDYASRYGGLSNIKSGLYEHPLSYLLDALMVGGAITKGAEVTGMAALKGSEAAGLAKTGALSDLLEAGIKPATAKAASLRTGLEALAGERPLSGLESLAAKALPSTTSKLVGDALETTTTLRNPVARLGLSPLKRLATRPLGDLEAEIGKLQGQVADLAQYGQKPPSELLSQIRHLSGLHDQAIAQGLGRLERPSVAAWNASLASRRFMAKVKGEAFSARLKATRVYENTIRPYMAADPSLEKIGAAYPTGLYASVPGYERAPWLARADMALPARVELPVGVRVGTGGLAERPALTLALDPEAAQIAQATLPEVAQRTEAVVQRLQGYAERIQSSPDLMATAGREVSAELDATNRLISQLHESLARRVSIERGQVAMEPGLQMTDELRLVDLEKMVDQFDSLASSPAQVLEETYAPLRMAHGASFSEQTGAFEGGPSAAELDDAFRAADQPAPTYFPFIDPEKAKASDFFSSKQLRGANIYARDPHLGRMKGIRLLEGSYERNPMEAYVRRAARGVRAQETYRTFTQMTRRFGRPIASAEDIPPGYAVVAPDLLFLHSRSAASFGDILDDLLSKGVDGDAALSEAITRVTVANQEAVAKLLNAGGVKMWAVPKVVTDRLNDAARAAGWFHGTKGLAYDSLMAGWRGLVLSGSPRWVVNNFLGNTVFAIMQGAKTADVVKLLGANFREMLGGRSAVLEELRKLPGFDELASTGFVGSAVSSYEPLKPALEATMAGRAIRTLAESKPMTYAQRFGHSMRQLNAVVEDSFRQASFLTAAERQAGLGAIKRTGRSFLHSDRRVGEIMGDGFTEAKAAAAAVEMNHFFGNYAALGPFERHVIRRWLVPFWGFYKHQGKLLLTFPFESPGRTQILSGLADVQREMISQFGPVPEWLEGAVPMGTPGQGEIPFFSSIGPNPFNASFQDPTSMLAPGLKVIFEQAKGRSMFTDQPFSDPNIIRPYGSDQAYRIVRDAAGNVTGVVPVGAPKPGIGWHLLQQIPQFNALAQTIAGGKTYDTAPFTALPGETGGARYPTDALAQLLKLSGLGTTPYDLASYQDYQARLQKAALSAALSQGG